MDNIFALQYNIWDNNIGKQYIVEHPWIRHNMQRVMSNDSAQWQPARSASCEMNTTPTKYIYTRIKAKISTKIVCNINIPIAPLKLQSAECLFCKIIIFPDYPYAQKVIQNISADSRISSTVELYGEGEEISRFLGLHL